MNFDARSEIYNKYRKADWRLTNKIVDLLSLEKGSIIADIGAGTGNYSIAIQNQGYQVIAIEPSIKMIEECSDSRNILFVNSPAENILLNDNIVDGTIIINAIHHFKNLAQAFYEVNRISKPGPLLILTFDPMICRKIWLYDYWPHLRTYIDEYYLNINILKELLRKIFDTEIEEIAYNIPIDFEDTFASALWGRPHLLLEEKRRSAMSLFNFMDSKQLKYGLKRLENDLLTKKWEKKYSYLSGLDSYDVGYRFLLLHIKR